RSSLNAATPVDIVRDGKHMTLDVTVKAMPNNFGREDQIQDQEEEHTEKSKDNSTYSADSLGMEVGDMTTDEAAANKGFEGVLVRKVEPETSAWEKGLRPGMLIRKVGKTDVHNVKEFETALKKETAKDGVMLQVRTERGSRFVVLDAQK